MMSISWFNILKSNNQSILHFNCINCMLSGMGLLIQLCSN